jgi:zinc transport system ATP-binding protein
VNGAVLLEACDLEVGRQRPLLRGVQWALRAGESWFVLGRNGAGKSTLVATLLGALPPLRGHVTAAPAIADRSGLGFVPQEQPFGAPLPLTVAEFAELGLASTTVARAERRARVLAALRRLGIDDLAGAQVGALSLGQRRRALVARALLRRPQLIALDEPTANLDAHGAHALCADLERLRAVDAVCLLHVAHDLVLARRFATHIALVADGAVQTGPAAELLDGPHARAALGVAEV